MVIEYFEAQIFQLFKSNPHIRSVEPARSINQAESTLEILFEDGTRIRVDLHRLPPIEEAETTEIEVPEETACESIQIGHRYEIWGMEVRVLRIEGDHVVFEETGQSAPLMGHPLSTFGQTAKYVGP